MPRARKLDQTIASKLRDQIAADAFLQKVFGTTLFRNISPDQLPLSTLEEICTVTKVIPLAKGHVLPIVDDKGAVPFLYEILSGYVKISDRAEQKSDKRRGLATIPPALLAWRVPGELLGDFLFTLPESDLHDHIVATDACELLRISADSVRKLARTYPQIFLNVAANLASKANKARVRAQALRLPSIKAMLARLFLELLKERNHLAAKPGRHVVNGTFRVEDIAAFIGYEYHRVQQGIHSLIEDDRLLAHHGTKKSGRFAIVDAKGLNQFIKGELTRAAEQSKRKEGVKPKNPPFAPDANEVLHR